MRLFLSLLLLFASTFSYSQSDFDHLSTLDGLSQNDVTFIFQDSKGFMWFGTYDGLNRFDGMNFVSYKRTTPMEFPIGSNLPYGMTEDTDGNFWIATSDNGVWFFDRKKEAFHKIPNEINGKQIILGTKIGKIFLDSRGMLWLVSTKGLSVIDTKAYRRNVYRGSVFETAKDETNKIQDLTNISLLKEDSKKQLWLSGTCGLFTFKLKKDLTLEINEVIPNFNCSDIVETKNGYLLSFNNAVYFLKGSRSKNNLDLKEVAPYFFANLIKTSKEFILEVIQKDYFSLFGVMIWSNWTWCENFNQNFTIQVVLVKTTLPFCTKISRDFCG